MKMYFSNKNILFIFSLLIAGVFSFSSCSKDGSGGTPEIIRIRAVDAEFADSSFDKALPGNLIVIEGENLGGAQNIYFNGYPASFNPVYNTNTHIIVQIPLKTPTPDKHPDVPGLIRVETNHGVAEYSFAINPPAPHIVSIYNENTLPGDTMIIEGMFFSEVDSVIFPGGKVSLDFQPNDSGTQLLVKVPDHIAKAGRLILNSPYGKDSSKFLVNNMSGPGVFANFNNPGENAFGWAFWGAIRSNDNILYPKSDGYYIRSKFSNVGPNDVGWWANDRNIAVSNTSVVVVPVSELGNAPDRYYLKFEINTRIPIKEGVVFHVDFQISNGNDVYTYDFEPYKVFGDGEVFDTKNKWKTVKFSLNKFGLPKVGDLLNPDGKGTVKDFHIGMISNEEPIPDFDAAFDNFRIEKL